MPPSSATAKNERKCLSSTPTLWKAHADLARTRSPQRHHIPHCNSPQTTNLRARMGNNDGLFPSGTKDAMTRGNHASQQTDTSVTCLRS
jgi:hypothetical protein